MRYREFISSQRGSQQTILSSENEMQEHQAQNGTPKFIEGLTRYYRTQDIFKVVEYLQSEFRDLLDTPDDYLISREKFERVLTEKIGLDPQDSQVSGFYQNCLRNLGQYLDYAQLFETLQDRGVPDELNPEKINAVQMVLRLAESLVLFQNR